MAEGVDALEQLLLDKDALVDQLAAVNAQIVALLAQQTVLYEQRDSLESAISAKQTAIDTAIRQRFGMPQR